MQKQLTVRPSNAFVGASWGSMIVGMLAYLIGLWNAQMQLNEKGYYFTILLYGCFAAVSLQKSVRDRAEGLPVTGMYAGLCWGSLMAAVLLLTAGLWNATLTLSEKGFYAMSFVLVLFAIVTVQKNVRDLAAAALAADPGDEPAKPFPSP
ncbi:inner membrane protein YiaA [Massilia sp. LXY-6]|uniref:inner membrane protein YiaA n=1 Tax=Massilia sp. LXY-6 TaxID=3379823 RepID=UPI003EDFEE58